MGACDQLASQSRIPSKGMVSPTVGTFLSLINVIKITAHKRDEKPISQVIVDFIKQIIEINYHNISTCAFFNDNETSMKSL